MAEAKSFLQKQLDHQKFLHAIDYVRKESQGLKRLSTTELSRTNQFLSGSADDPWRFESARVHLPDGSNYDVNVIVNPVNKARELLGDAIEKSGNGFGIEAAHELYAQLVLNHLFKAANRRTAVSATLWILLISGLDCDANELLNLKIGDLRNPTDYAELMNKIKQIVRKS
jgi:hypothetical protein